MSRNFEVLQQFGKVKEELLTQKTIDRRDQVADSSAFVPDYANGEIAKLVQRLFLHSDQIGKPKVVSFSGAASEERSSWICAEAARSLACQESKSVCLVDANFWSPRLHSYFGCDNRAGLATALMTEDPIRRFIVPLSMGNLWLMPSGGTNQGLYSLVERWRERCSQLREEFDYVLINACSLARETEATLLGQMADGVVLILDANQSRRQAVRRTKERLTGAGVHVLGAVLDQRTFPIPEFLYRKL
jgi:succinoglycan biosynthesis transport protein ExoP